MFINFGLLSEFRVIIWSRSATLAGHASASFSHGKGEITIDIMGLTPASCEPYKCTSLRHLIPLIIHSSRQHGEHCLSLQITKWRQLTNASTHLLAAEQPSLPTK